MCDVFGVSPSAYYEWEREQESDHARRDSELLVLVQQRFSQSLRPPGPYKVGGAVGRLEGAVRLQKTQGQFGSVGSEELRGEAVPSDAA